VSPELIVMEQTFEGKVAVVTGAARGIGRAVALRLARAGADIALADVNLDGAQQWGETLTAATVADEVRALGRRSIGVENDLSKRTSAEALIAQTVRELGRIDILVNCAGGAFTPIETSFASISPDQDMDLLFGANYASAVFCCQSALPHLRAAGPGAAIVNISSGAGNGATRDGSIAHYLAAKAALTSFTRALAGELGPAGIRVNAIAPGIIFTARVAKLAKERDLGTDTQLAQVALRRWGNADDVAKVVEFLTSDMAGYVTGQSIAVNGGGTLSPN
jgi:NAD(P)-dependent dehydrogenase (short-subunit alcohol dehydrogenase family)